MPRQGKEHALGPYKHGRQHRIVYVGANGSRETVSYEDEAKAIEERDAYNKAAGSRTVGEAVAEYLKEHPDETTKFRLYAILRLPGDDRPLSAITEAVARKLYETRQGECAVATHHGELRYVKRFFARQVELGRVRIHPFANIQPVGEQNRGKPKLRVKATRLFLAALLQDDSPEATAVLTTITFKLRARGVTDRLVQDLDDDGQIFWVRDSKTKSSDMEIEVPDFLRVRLLKLAEGKKPTDKLFTNAEGKPLTRYGLHYWTVEFCKRAGVDRVTPHGLRGSGATQAVRSGEAIERVAIETGHADRGMTLQRHYLGGGAIESGHARRVERLVMTTDLSVPNQDNPEVN